MKSQHGCDSHNTAQQPQCQLRHHDGSKRLAMTSTAMQSLTQKLHVLTEQFRPCDLWFDDDISRDCQLTLACPATSMMVRCSCNGSTRQKLYTRYQL